MERNIEQTQIQDYLEMLVLKQQEEVYWIVHGNVLVSTDMGFSLEMYKTKVDNHILNSSISLMTSILEQNGDTYKDNFPISINPCEYHFSSEEDLANWKDKYKIPKEASAEEAIYIFKDKYEIESEEIEEIRRILAIRYAISTEGYSATKSIEISSSISRQSAVMLQENGSGLTGVNVVIEPIRKYPGEQPAHDFSKAYLIIKTLLVDT